MLDGVSLLTCGVTLDASSQTTTGASVFGECGGGTVGFLARILELELLE